jgi:hypothetical protein
MQTSSWVGWDRSRACAAAALAVATAWVRQPLAANAQPGRQRQAGVHEQVVGRYTRRGFGCRFIGFSRLAELGVSFGQREATRRGQTRWHAVSLGPGKRFMQEFHRVVRGAAEGWSA